MNGVSMKKGHGNRYNITWYVLFHALSEECHHAHLPVCETGAEGNYSVMSSICITQFAALTS